MVVLLDVQGDTYNGTFGPLECVLTDDAEWDAMLAADCLSAVMQALAQLPIEPLQFQQAIMKAAMGVGQE